MMKSPFLEQLIEKDLEVIFLTDAIDEYMMSNLPEYDERKFQNAAKDDLKLGGKKGKKDRRIRVSSRAPSHLSMHTCPSDQESVYGLAIW